MSSIRVPGSVYRRASGRWAAVTPPVFDSNVGRRRRISLGTFESREDALETLTAFQGDRRTAEIGRQRLAEYLTRWLELVKSQVAVGHIGRRTATGYEQAVRLHISPAMGHLRLDELNHLIVHDWLASLRVGKGLSDQTVVRLYRTLHRAIADAPLDRNLVALPLHMRPVVRSRREIVRPTAEDIRSFLAHTASCNWSEYTHPLFRLAAVSGMRGGELAGVAWLDVDFNTGTLRVERSLGVDLGEVFAKTPKSAAGERVIGLDSETTSILRSHRSRLASDRLATGEPYETKPLGWDLVFRAGPGGGLVRPDQISRYFTREWRHAGLQAGVTLHSLRHSVASILVGAGLSLVEVAAHMGHSVEVLQRTYARDLDPEAREKRVVDVITARLGS